MSEVTISVKVDGKEMIRQLRFDKTGALLGALDASGRDLLREARTDPQGPKDEDVELTIDFKMKKAAGCCWTFIDGTWRCLAC